MIKKFLITVFFIFLTSIPVFCSEVLNFNGFISDNADVISPENEAMLNRVLYELQTKTRVEIGVVTLKTLQYKPIEDVSLEIARKSKLGDKKLNNGVLILVVPNDRKARIEVGYGLEWTINDSKAGRILDNYMIPYFKEGDYETGIVQGTLALAFKVAKSYGVELSCKKPVPVKKEDYDDTFLIIMLILVLFVFNNRGGRGGPRIFGSFSGFRGGGGGSGISFGGGGGFGGGGASRGW